eukprot:3113246-Amphidinium_carterae.1
MAGPQDKQNSCWNQELYAKLTPRVPQTNLNTQIIKAANKISVCYSVVLVAFFLGRLAAGNGEQVLVPTSVLEHPAGCPQEVLQHLGLEPGLPLRCQSTS